MALYHIAGAANDLGFVVVQRLCDLLEASLPDIKVYRHLFTAEAWKATEALRLKKELGASAVGGVLTWSKGRVIGGAKEFEAEVKRLYGVANDLSPEDMEAIAKENMQEANLEERRAEVAKSVKGRTALIVVDVQNDFCESGALAVPDGNAVVPCINKLRAAVPFDLVVLTQDYHPPGHASFASSHPGEKLFTEVELPGIGKQMMWPDHCVEESKGAEFHPELDRKETDVVVQKGRHMKVDSYSGFGDATGGSLEKTRLDDVLKEHNIQTLFVVGLATDYCVGFTCLDGCRYGYQVFLVKDCARGIAESTIKERVEEAEKAGVVCISSDEVPRAFSSPEADGGGGGDKK